MSLELIDFNFTATANMAAGSQVTITIPAGWTAPTIANSAGVLAINPTTPALTTPICTLPTAGTPQMAVSGSGPWTITIDVTCAAGSTFRVRWGNTLANVITAPTAGTYVFTTKSKGPGGTLTDVAAPQPTITVQKATPTTPTISNLPANGQAVGGSFTPTVSTTGDGVKSVTSNSTGVCTVSGGVVTYIAIGTCSLTAHVAAGTNYTAADGSAQTFTVSVKATPTTPTISNLPANGQAVGGSFTPTVSTTGDGVKSVTSNSTGVCTVSGGVVTYIAIGTCSLTAHVAAGTNYTAADGSAQTFTVSVRATSTVTVTCTAGAPFTYTGSAQTPCTAEAYERRR